MRRTRPSRLLITGLSALAIVAAAAGQSVSEAAPQAPVATRTLAFDVLHVQGLASSGPASPALPLHIAVQLRNPRSAALQALANDIYKPGSPDYHRYRTPDQLAAEFGLSAATGAHLQSWLRSGGLELSYTSPSNDFVQAVGTVQQLDRLFSVTLRNYHSNTAGDFIANDVAPQVPADLDVATIAGLNTLQRFHTPQVPNPVTAAHRSSSGCFLGIPTPCESAYDPIDMWSMYNMPAGNLGQGQTVAVFGEGQTDPVITDLRLFENHNNLPHVPVVVKHEGAGPFINNDGQGEWNLDTESSTGMAPDVSQLVLYFGSSLTDADVLTLFTAWKDDANGPHQANASFGECETDPLNPVVGNPAANPAEPIAQGLGDNLEPAIETTLMPMIVAEGRTLFNSTGDTGSSCPVVIASGVGALNGVANQGVPLQQYPAVSNYVLAVGGTLLYSDGGTPAKRTMEISGPFGGGGQSIFNKEPDYQKKVSAINRPCALVDYNGNPYPPLTICKGVPDVAALFGDVLALGYNIYLNGRIITTGGTSLSSPLWMGMWTRAQAAAADQVHGLGFAAPVIYDKGTGPNYAKDFFDITVGTNGLYVAAPGWDYTTGFGSPNLTNLIQDIDGRTAVVAATAARPLIAAPLQQYNACGPVFVSPANNAIDGNLFNYPGGIARQDQLDILRGDLTLTADNRYLRTVLTINNLQQTVPPDGNLVPNPVLPDGEDWVFDVNVNGKTYYADTHFGTLSGLSFTDGVIDPTGFAAPNANGKPVGKFNAGPNGTIVVDLPLADIGNPRIGDRIQYPFGFTALNSLLPFLNFPDAAGGQYDYVLGGERHCAVQPVSSAPLPAETPTPNTESAKTRDGVIAVVVLLGGAVLLMALRRRRRRPY